MSYLIACIDSKSGLGLQNDIPWKNTIDGKDDMKMFKEVTKDNAVLMGYTTYVSIGRPLPNRLNIVISNSNYESIKDKKGLHVFRTLKEGVEFGKEYEEKTNKKCFICGGGMIYDAYLDSYKPKQIYMTKLNRNFNCDTFFPIEKMEDYHSTSIELLRYKMFIYSYE